METHRKSELIDFLYQRVQRHLNLAISILQNEEAEILLKPTSTGGWSIAQCLEHLNSYGLFYLPEIEKALQKSSKVNQNTFKSGWLGAFFTRMMEPSDKKYKAFKGHNPLPQLDAHAVVAEFISQQERLLQSLEKARSSDLERRVPTSISVLIKLKLGDVFQFVIAHNERHIQQALRNLPKK